MATSDLHIPDDEIRGAFDLAMTALVRWTKEGGEEPNVTLNRRAVFNQHGGRSRRNVQGDNAGELIAGEWPLTQIALLNVGCRQRN